MANLLKASECRRLVQTSLNDHALEEVIGRVEAEITAVLGAPYDGTTTLTETVQAETGAKSIFVKRPIASVSSLTEYSGIGDTTGTALTQNTDYYVWAGQGRIERIGYTWAPLVTVVYISTDQREKRKQATIDLVRLILSQSAYQSESIAGEYTYRAPDNWEAEKRRVLKRLQFQAI